MRRTAMMVAGCLATVGAAPVAAQAPGTAAFAESLVANVVRIQAGGSSGFGFIVGLGPRQVIIATALHTLTGSDGAAPEVCLPPRGDSCTSATLLYIADAVGDLPALDLAFLTIPYPDGLAWRPDAMATRSAPGTAVRSIGRGRTWHVPEESGRIVPGAAPDGFVHYAGVSLAEGVSGAPIVSDDGIVALHVQSAGDEDGAQGIDIQVIRERLTTQARGRWALVPRGECDALATHRQALGGRTVTLHFDGGAPERALDATARLHCLGARVLLRPTWEASGWPGERVVYRSGDVRFVRSLQSVLASFGRLNTILGQPDGDAELWIR